MSYAPIILPADLKTHIFATIVNEITRSDSTITETAIGEAIAEIKAYLSRYDLIAMFGSEADDAAATYQDKYLNSLVKDITVWRIIKLGNPNMLYENVRQHYEDHIKTLPLPAER